ncbi:flavonoid 3'-monooxygenase CYP75B137-like isoform X3 [Macadamia integrifolia]|uniref:flavonoid 3'-monooxygenase CYP75B137-like isoform X3 n=1 Tax=Macadamia integrifolia TaxID=60698 RepID=UPI001C4FFCE6|nr:flavonoid 3'-monooxygenase CYP75B137-like isoform X3 [Macadamia integrifolia]
MEYSKLTAGFVDPYIPCNLFYSSSSTLQVSHTSMASNTFTKIVYLVCDEFLWFFTILTLSFISISFAARLFVSKKKSTTGEILRLPPGPRGLPLLGIERKGKELLSWLDGILDSVISERLKIDGVKEKGVDFNDTENKDFLQILLELKQQGDDKKSLKMIQVKALLLDIVLGGTDTSATTLEWALAEMMQHPEVMRKAQEELAQVFGTSNMVEESNLPNLPYLNAVVKETLRLHPPIPLLIPHCPSQSCTIGQYTIPQGTNVFLNVWKMHRDPEAWESPSEFLPERFLGDTNGYDFKGNNFNYLPFGSGRRICAGIPLVEKMSTYVLASLLHLFEWRLPENAELDLSEKLRFLLKKTTPLLIIPTPRLSNVELYT